MPILDISTTLSPEVRPRSTQGKVEGISNKQNHDLAPTESPFRAQFDRQRAEHNTRGSSNDISHEENDISHDIESDSAKIDGVAPGRAIRVENEVLKKTKVTHDDAHFFKISAGNNIELLDQRELPKAGMEGFLSGDTMGVFNSEVQWRLSEIPLEGDDLNVRTDVSVVEGAFTYINTRALGEIGQAKGDAPANAPFSMQTSGSQSIHTNTPPLFRLSEQEVVTRSSTPFSAPMLTDGALSQAYFTQARSQANSINTHLTAQRGLDMPPLKSTNNSVFPSPVLRDESLLSSLTDKNMSHHFGQTISEDLVVGSAKEGTYDVRPLSASVLTPPSLYSTAMSDADMASSGRFSVDVQFGRADWHAHVAEKVAQMAASNLQFAEIQLDPPELGPLQVRVQVNSEHAHVVFNAHNASVRDALDQNSARLREMFEAEGYVSVDVDVNDRDASGDSDDAGFSDGDDAVFENDALADENKITRHLSVNAGIDDFV